MDILETLGSMLQKTITIQDMDLPQQTKDNAKNIMNQSLNMVIEQTHPRKINQIVMNELRKKHREGDSIGD
jgi:flagellar motor component MotA